MAIALCPALFYLLLYEVSEHYNKERELLCDNHLEHIKAGDVLLLDRGYTSYFLFAKLRKQGIHFVCRCPRNSYKESQELFERPVPSKTTTISFPSHKRRPKELKNLPQSLHVRFVRVVLDNGEIEVLVTSLLDEEKYPLEDFHQLYGKRWGVETFFLTIKERLRLEHFTGKSVSSVLQDFYATIFISNLETILTGYAEQQLKHKADHNQNSQKVNKAVSFNAIKNNLIDLLMSETDLDTVFNKMTALFLINPTQVRKARSTPRKETSMRQLINYFKRKRKETF